MFKAQKKPIERITITAARNHPDPLDHRHHQIVVRMFVDSEERVSSQMVLDETSHVYGDFDRLMALMTAIIKRHLIENNFIASEAPDEPL